MPNIPRKIVRMIPRLGSDNDGEVVATARAIGRALAAEGMDWHDLAKAISAPLSQPGRPVHSGPSPEAVKRGAMATLSKLMEKEELNFLERSMAERLYKKGQKGFFNPTEIGSIVSLAKRYQVL